jgi:hypothetical protein
MESPATQNLADRQDTVLSSLPGSMTAAEFEEIPLNVNALAPLSTAAQKLGEEHDTDAMPGWGARGRIVNTRSRTPRGAIEQKADESRASTAMHKLADGHDTDVGSSTPWP